MKPSIMPKMVHLNMQKDPPKDPPEVPQIAGGTKKLWTVGPLAAGRPLPARRRFARPLM